MTAALPTEYEPFDATAIDVDSFLAELKALRAEIDASLGAADVAHLRKIERIGRVATAIGLATCWVAPNPLSAAALSFGRATRWVMMHHIGHRGYDKVPGVPPRYTSKVFARGKRRFVDWLDWIVPEAWVHVHHEHHSYTGEEADPDLFERRTERLRTPAFSMAARYAVIGSRVFSWRFVAYAPNANREWMAAERAKETRRQTGSLPAEAPITDARELWLRGVLPHAAWYFGVLPAAFLPLGPWAAASALANSVGAELLMNAHTFLVTLANHTGDDVHRFSSAPGSKPEWVLRQILGTSNYSGGGNEVADLAHLYLNYQIEHHLWPDLPMQRYREVQPRVKALCAKYGVPYVEEGVFARVRKLVDVAVGKTRMLRSASVTVAPATARPLVAASMSA
jgi:fatty acid desaturase